MKEREDYVNPILNKDVKGSSKDDFLKKGADKVPVDAQFVNDKDSLSKQVQDLTKGLKQLMFENKTAVK